MLLLPKTLKMRCLTGLVVAILMVYIGHVLLIHLSNAQHQQAWDLLRSQAIESGMKWRPQADELELYRSYKQGEWVDSPNGPTDARAGYVDKDGQVVVPYEYIHVARYFSEGFAFVVTVDGKKGYIRPDNSFAFEADYTHASSFVNGMAKVRIEHESELITPQIRSGFIDRTGRLVVPIVYEHAYDYVGNHTMCRKRTIYAIVSDQLMDGIDISIPPVDWLFPNRWVFLDNTGTQVSPGSVKRSLEE